MNLIEYIKSVLNRVIKGKNNEKVKRYTNKKSLSTVQGKRIEEYSEGINHAIEDVFDKYSAQIAPSFTEYIRRTGDVTMMLPTTRITSAETTNRLVHMKNVEDLATKIAEAKKLRVGLTKIIAGNHDLGHTPLGHESERWISDILEDLGIGYFRHNALGPERLINRYNIYDDIMKRIIKYYPELEKNEAEKKRIKRSLWLIFDGINSHNGEKTETEFIPNKHKTERDFREEVFKCFVIKDYDKTIVPATVEGCLIRLCDKISYIPYDMVDGIREGFIDEIDDEYISVLYKFGISRKEVDRCNTLKDYRLIIDKIQDALVEDVINNSSDSAIRMSLDTSKALHELRNINNRRILAHKLLKEDNEIYPVALKSLMERCSEIVERSGILQELEYSELSDKTTKELMIEYKGTPDEKFASYLTGMTRNEYDFIAKVVEQTEATSAREELEIAKKFVMENPNEGEYQGRPGFENKNARINSFIRYYREQYDSLEDKEKFNINVTEHDIRHASEYEETSLMPFDKKMSMLIAAKFISTLSDHELIRILQKTRTITSEQAQSLSRKYRDMGMDMIKEEEQMQPGFAELQKRQAEETKRIGIEAETKSMEKEEER